MAELTQELRLRLAQKPARKDTGKIRPLSAATSRWAEFFPPKKWPGLYSCALLSVATVLCLAPFSGKAFHIDDPLFVWTAQHISHNLLDPYRFELIWDITRVPMFEVTQNPPLAAYYAALAGSVAGWSERALHIAFLFPSLILVLGTYRLAQRFTRFPLMAAAASLLTPGFLVSASSVMCDVMMLALWVLAMIFWIEGFDAGKPLYLIVSALLIAACALTKYFGASLIPLCLTYSIVRQRRIEYWAWCLLIPVMLLVGYQLWTSHLYGRGLLLGAAEFAQSARTVTQASIVAKMLIAASYVGGCMLSVALFAPLVWSRRQILLGALLGAVAAVLIVRGWVNLGMQVGGEIEASFMHAHWLSIGFQLALCITGGLSILGLALTDYWKQKNADSMVLSLWVIGTFVFAAFLNWTINVRSLLPLVPAAGILLARRFEGFRVASLRSKEQVVAILTISGLIAFWITSGDAAVANSAREAASRVRELSPAQGATVWFEGHWGFQYYMESLGARPVDIMHPRFRPGDLVVIPEDNIQVFPIQPQFVESSLIFQLEAGPGVTTHNWQVGAGFYSSLWGPLPFVVGSVPAERYEITRMAPAVAGAFRQP